MSEGIGVEGRVGFLRSNEECGFDFEGVGELR